MSKLNGKEHKHKWFVFRVGRFVSDTFLLDAFIIEIACEDCEAISFEVVKANCPSDISENEGDF